jgi:hypothetical protein
VGWILDAGRWILEKIEMRIANTEKRIRHSSLELGNPRPGGFDRLSHLVGWILDARFWKPELEDSVNRKP